MSSGAVDIDHSGAKDTSTGAKNTRNTQLKDDIEKERDRLELLRKRERAAMDANDISTAADIKYYAIPDVEDRIAQLVQQQKEEEERETPSAAAPSATKPASQKDDKKLPQKKDEKKQQQQQQPQTQAKTIPAKNADDDQKSQKTGNNHRSRSLQTEVETESEDSDGDEEDDSGNMDLYD